MNPFPSDEERRQQQAQQRVDELASDLWIGVAIVLTALISVCLLAMLVWGVPAFAQTAPNPPLLLRIDQPAIAYAPSGERIALPAGTEIDACASAENSVLDYELASRVVHIPAPCADRPLFRDGFEAAP